MVRKGNEGIYQNHPFLHDVFIWDKNRKYKSLFENWKAVTAQKFDLVLNFQRFGATGLFTALCGAVESRGFSKNPFSIFFSKSVPHKIGDGIHETARNQSLIDDLPGVEPQLPKVYPSGADFEKISSFRSEPYLCIAPTSVWFTKQYPADKWVELIDALPGRYRVYLLGAPGDAEACEAILKQTNKKEVFNLCGQLNLLQSAALMRHAVMNYVNDSAPMHLCSAVNAPVTAVYCSTVPKFGFGPLSDTRHVVQVDESLDCRPCNLHGKRACPLGHFKCARNISTSQLLATLPKD